MEPFHNHLSNGVYDLDRNKAFDFHESPFNEGLFLFLREHGYGRLLVRKRGDGEDTPIVQHSDMYLVLGHAGVPLIESSLQKIIRRSMNATTM